MTLRRLLLIAVAGGAIVLAATGCSTISYYSQAVTGHLDVMARAKSVEARIADPATPAALRDRLRIAAEIREFATRSLALPDNASYRKYADLERPYVLWNVVAADEFSVRARESCFPVAGCVAYRGFYAEGSARSHGQSLTRAGHDVFVYGVPAYSTIGWFSDPLLNTFINYPDAELARLIFHELAHQVVYIKNDSTFNESFAVAVEEVGVERWIAERGTPDSRATYATSQARRKQFIDLVLRYQGTLDALYNRDIDTRTKRLDKTRAFDAMKVDYESLKREWGGWTGYDRWFAQGLNNAHLASVATYTQLLPAFRGLIRKHNGDMAAFYREVSEIGALPATERARRLAISS
jgi:predicted aminopeptidase